MYFALELLNEVAFVDQVGLDDFNDDIALHGRLSRPINGGHTAFAEQSSNLILAEALSDQVCLVGCNLPPYGYVLRIHSSSD